MIMLTKERSRGCTQMNDLTPNYHLAFSKRPIICTLAFQMPKYLSQKPPICAHLRPSAANPIKFE
jgi:hypothetical protein